jgi:hypothetical protein
MERVVVFFLIIHGLHAHGHLIALLTYNMIMTQTKSRYGGWKFKYFEMYKKLSVLLGVVTL